MLATVHSIQGKQKSKNTMSFSQLLKKKLVEVILRMNDGGNNAITQREKTD